MTPLHHSLLLGPVSFLKLLESEGESFPFLENILSLFFLPSSLPSIFRACGEGNLGLVGLVLPLRTRGWGDAFADAALLARDCLQAESSQRPGPQRSGCGSLKSRRLE